MKLDIIWNISLICPWDCEFCCTDAAHVKSSNNDIIISDQSFSRNTTVKIETGTIFKNRYPNIKPSKFDLALIDRQSKGIEPSFQEKVRILKNLKGNDVTIDFAGGDPLACYENYLVIKEAARYFGKDNISITSTGHSLSKYNIYDIANIIGEFEFTYDEPSSVKDSTRPTGYNNSNIQIAKKFSSLGIRTKAQIPIHENNHRHEEVAEIYTTLDNANVNEILIMRTFPVGRGSKFLKKNP